MSSSRARRRLGSVLCRLLLLVMGAETAAADPLAWVQLGDGGRPSVRAVLDRGPCPIAEVDGRALPLKLRAAPDPLFPNLICEAELPAGAAAASLAGRPLPLPRPVVRRIVLFGDTGCRLQGLKVQNCDDPRAWPFAKVAELAAAEKPDLIIHLGDYYYRESPCPLDWRGCADSPHGDAWATWAADFLDPARPLFAAAPFVFARGNHETCSRGGAGWFRLLDAGALRPCEAATPAFAVPLGGGLVLHVIDSALAGDQSAPAAAVARVAGALRAEPVSPGQRAWIITHRPFWGLVPVARFGPLPPLEVAINRTEQSAAREVGLDGIELILSGHIHHFESLSFGPTRPAQLIVGTGGDVGEDADSPKPDRSGAIIDGLRVKRLEFDRFGYVVLWREAGDDWGGAFKDFEGRVRAVCRLKDRDLSCDPVAR